MQRTSTKPKPKRFVKEPSPPLSLKGLMLFVLPMAALPATVIAFGKGDLIGIFVNGGGYSLYLLAAILLRRGLRQEADYHERRISRAPKWSFKIYAAILVAVATWLIACFGADYTFPVSVLFGICSMLGMYLTYGFDPRREKMIDGSHGYSAGEVTDTIAAAEQIISQIEQANRRIENTEFNNRIVRICHEARSVLEIIEQDPGDIRRARKFLNVYLDGARRVSEGYANTHERMNSEQLEDNFREILQTIETVFKEQKQKLLENDFFDLDVQMEVLATQLKREGVL